MSNSQCTHCGFGYESRYPQKHIEDCNRRVASNQMKALQSIAESFARMIKEEYSDEEPSEVRIVGDGTGPDPMWAKFRRD